MMTRARMMTPKAKTPRTVAPLALATTVARMRQPRARARIRMMRPRARAKARARMVAPRPKARAKMVARPKARARMVAPRPKARAKMVARPKARARMVAPRPKARAKMVARPKARARMVAQGQGWWHEDQRQKATGWDPDTRRLLGMFEVSVQGKHVLQKSGVTATSRPSYSLSAYLMMEGCYYWILKERPKKSQHGAFLVSTWSFATSFDYICQWPPSIIWL